MTQDKEITRLADESALRRLIYTYGRCCDKRDGATFANLFAPGGALIAYSGTRRDTPEEISKIPGLLSRFVKTYHTVSNHIFDIDGDRATGEIYSLSHHLSPLPDGKFSDIGKYITYRDRYVRTSNGWKFEHRQVILEFEETFVVEDNGGKLPSL